MAQKYRAQILLEPEQQKTLAEIAVREQRSVSDVVREAVAEYVVAKRQRSARERRLEALKRVDEHRRAVLEECDGKPIDVDAVALVRQMREERDNELFAAVEDIKQRRS
jgi:predicted component of type VI protein secretion system